VVEVGNRIFLSSTFTPQPQYQNILKKYYYADIARVDFPSTVQAAQSINGWVNMVTHGQIPSLVDPGMYYTVRSKCFRTDFFLKIEDT
jgi:serine protease inhibitor